MTFEDTLAQKKQDYQQLLDAFAEQVGALHTAAIRDFARQYPFFDEFVDSMGVMSFVVKPQFRHHHGFDVHEQGFLDQVIFPAHLDDEIEGEPYPPGIDGQELFFDYEALMDYVCTQLEASVGLGHIPLEDL